VPAHDPLHPRTEPTALVVAFECSKPPADIVVLSLQALEEYLDGGFNEAAVIKQVTNGKNAMPAFGGRLSDDDIANVATYVISTAKSGWD